MKFFRSLILVWILLWLAGSGAFAAALPFCKHDNANHQGHVAGLVQKQSEQHAHHHMHGDRRRLSDIPEGSPGVLCGNCDLCHMSVFVLPPQDALQLFVIDGAIYQSFFSAAFASRFPDKPLRIPLSPLV